MSDQITMAGMSKLTINKNTFCFKNTVIQISNITSVNLGTIKKKIPRAFFVMLIIGFFMLISGSIQSNSLFKSDDGNVTLGIGMIIILISGVAILSRVGTGSNYYIVLSLNSGEKICFFSKNSEFLKEALNRITDCFNNHSSYILNFEKCMIQQVGGENYMDNRQYSNVSGVAGDGNIISGMVGSGNEGNYVSGTNSINTIDWESLDRIFERRLMELNPGSEAYQIASQAKMYTKERDKEGLKVLVQGDKEKFAKEVLFGLAAEVVTKIITSILF